MGSVDWMVARSVVLPLEYFQGITLTTWLQRYGPESTGRDKAPLATRLFLWKRIAEHDEAIDWEVVRAAAEEPRGLAFPVGPGPASDLAAILAAAPRVRNALPVGATWDGVEDQYAGDPQFARPAEPEAEKASSGN